MLSGGLYHSGSWAGLFLCGGIYGQQELHCTDPDTGARCCLGRCCATLRPCEMPPTSTTSAGLLARSASCPAGSSPPSCAAVAATAASATTTADGTSSLPAAAAWSAATSSANGTRQLRRMRLRFIGNPGRSNRPYASRRAQRNRCRFGMRPDADELHL
jgi:hypothetical protein